MQDAPNPRAALLRDRNFTWLMSGGAISTLGDQFAMIALRSVNQRDLGAWDNTALTVLNNASQRAGRLLSD